MRRGVGAISRWVGFALLPLLSGCFLSSKAPILDRTDIAAGFGAGRYSTLEGLKPDDLAKLPEAARGACVDPDYVATERDENFKPTGEHTKIVYCAYDADKGEAKPLSDISIAGADYHWQGGTEKSDFRLKHIRDGYYLMQAVAAISGDVKLDGPLYIYLVLRVRPDRIEVFLPDCAQFPAIQTKRTPPVECGVTSAAALSNDLLAYTAQIDSGAEVPVAMFKPAG
jgi:hypothetical protein